MKKKKAKGKKPSKDSFKEVARRLGCDEDKARFEKKLREIAKAKPKRGK